MTDNNKISAIRDALLKENGNDPAEIAMNVMKSDFVSIHGPEHHFLDGAAFIVAYRNAGGARCCKRHAFLALTKGVKFVNKKYGVHMTIKPFRCTFSDKNAQCLKENARFSIKRIKLIYSSKQTLSHSEGAFLCPQTLFIHWSNRLQKL